MNPEIKKIIFSIWFVDISLITIFIVMCYFQYRDFKKYMDGEE